MNKQLLEELYYTKSRGYNYICIPRRSYSNFMNLIGTDPEPGYEYKWEEMISNV